MAPGQGYPSLEGCCYGCRLSIPKHEVSVFKEEIWNLGNRLAISDVQPLKSLILLEEHSPKNHSDSGHCSEKNQKSCMTFQSDVQNICVL